MISKLYIQNEDGKYEEIKSTNELNLESTEIKGNYFLKSFPKEWCVDINFRLKPTYKKWYKKKKGKHYVWYYKKKYGIDPKIIKLVKGGKDE